ncbi:MAG: hypothetical protein Kow0063_22280 [Anaerolineae bacterium]
MRNNIASEQSLENSIVAWLRAIASWNSLRALPIWLGLAVLVGGFYLLLAAQGYGVAGFPLDDAWIHQTYARNLATTGQWAFVAGQTSAGSTSPLWSLLLSLGYWLGVPYQVWTYGLGMVALGLTGWSVARLGGRLFPDRPWVGPLGGFLCVMEWHLTWASVSGMETILYTWLSVLVVDLWLLADRRDLPGSSPVLGGAIRAASHWWGLGLVGGLLVLTRPEGLGLVGLIGLAAGWRLRHMPGRLLRTWAAIGIGLALPLIPYLVFHYLTTGLPFPNTFYAKQEEYRLLLSLYPLWRRWLMVAAVTLVGGQVLLLPGFAYAIWRSSSRLRSPVPGLWPSIYGPLLCAVWWFIHLTLYGLRLPVTYQHGRYQMPVIPFFILIGLGGTTYLLRPRARMLLLRVLSRASVAATFLLFLVFLALGARAYATDVAFIQGEMVAVARWLAANVPPESLIAVHDIGAIGYFTPRPLLDLAGLVTPEVIPFITDEVGLIEFMQARGADYVVFFPDWSDAYRRMAADPRLQPVYATGFEWTLEQGRANMTVYRLQRRHDR